MAPASAVVGVDVGGTNVMTAAFDEDHRIGGRRKIATPRDGPEAALAAVVAVIESLQVEVAAVGIGIPGPVSKGVVYSPPNMIGWTEPVDVVTQIQERLGVPVVVDNDVTVAVIGEWHAGAAAGASFVLGVWLGTGVGGGLVLDGRPYRGAVGAAGEFGHTMVRKGGAMCGCGRRGCVEAYAGRACMERMVATAVEAGERTALLEIAEKRGKTRLTSGVWAEALKSGDQVASRIIAEAVEAVGIGIGSAVNLLDLDTVVIGGGLAEKLGHDLVDRIRMAAEGQMLAAGGERRFALAELGDDAGVIGAGALARTLLG